MRTTVTLEEDVQTLVDRLRTRRNTSFKEIVNEALRIGLREIEEPTAPRRVYRTRSASLGQALVPSLDDVAEAIAFAEGEDTR